MPDENKKVEKTEKTVDERIDSMTATMERIAEEHDGFGERVQEELKKEFGKNLRDALQERDDKLEKLEARAKKIETELAERALPGEGDDDADLCGYEDAESPMGEWVRDVIGIPNKGRPERLEKLTTREIARLDPEGKRDLATSSGADGGVLMPKQFYGDILTVPDDTQYMRDMCRELPPGTPPNSELQIPYLDQTGSKGIYAGAMVYSAKEADNLTKGDTPQFKTITLKPNKAGVYVVVTEELIANAPAAAGFIVPLFRGGQSAWIDDKLGTGTGAGEPKGFRGCSAQIVVERKTTSHINYQDLVYMYARTLGRGKYVWLCNKVTVLPELMLMKDDASRPIWTQNAREGEPNRLINIPVFYDELGPNLGSTGDLMLVDMNYVLLKPGMPPTLKNDQGFSNFIAGKITTKMTFWMDGQPWLQSPLTLRDGTNTVSPFIALAP